MDRTHGPMRGRAWAPDDADVMNADMPRCIGKSGHAGNPRWDFYLTRREPTVLF